MSPAGINLELGAALQQVLPGSSLHSKPWLLSVQLSEGLKFTSSPSVGRNETLTTEQEPLGQATLSHAQGLISHFLFLHARGSMRLLSIFFYFFQTFSDFDTFLGTFPTKQQ